MKSQSFGDLIQLHKFKLFVEIIRTPDSHPQRNLSTAHLSGGVEGMPHMFGGFGKEFRTQNV